MTSREAQGNEDSDQYRDRCGGVIRMRRSFRMVSDNDGGSQSDETRSDDT